MTGPFPDRGRLVPRRLGAGDTVRVAAVGLRARPVRLVLSALGIAIGIAAMVGVIGISSSSRADLDAQLDALGTNLLTVGPGEDLFGGASSLPVTAIPMIDAVPPVTSSSATGHVDAKVYRNDLIPEAESGSIVVLAAKTDLLATVDGQVESGAFLNGATAQHPAVVLGADAADRLGVGTAGPAETVLLGGRWYTVVGVLEPVPLAPELDTAALVGWDVAERGLGFDGAATTVYTRAEEDSVTDVQGVLAATANPAAPNEVEVSRPSDALAAQEAADATLQALLLGLGAVALLVGGIGVANTLVVSVLERRGEIGLRRALGATRGQIRSQFLTEALLLSSLGGAGGVVVGTAVTCTYALVQSWPATVPLWAAAGAIGATVVIGIVAGLYPAVRASRLPPTGALAAPGA